MTAVENPLGAETIEIDVRQKTVTVLDQRKLPHRLERLPLKNSGEAAEAIRNMTVRGAPLIGITGAAGLALAAESDDSDTGLRSAAQDLIGARPTAVNLSYAVQYVLDKLLEMPRTRRQEAAWALALGLKDSEFQMSLRMGQYAADIIEDLYRRLGRPVRLLTHCNAGALATVGPGTATAGFYTAHARGIPIHVYADETRPRLQGVMTAWELSRFGISTDLVADNAGGLMMMRGMVDAVFVGADRIALNGDTANKVGTYLKALAAFDNQVPFYVAAPISTFDRSALSGSDIVIEERSADEVRTVVGADQDGEIRAVRITEAGQSVFNPGFDVTPSRLITGFVTDLSVYSPDRLSDLWSRHEK